MKSPAAYYWPVTGPRAVGGNPAVQPACADDDAGRLPSTVLLPSELSSRQRRSAFPCLCCRSDVARPSKSDAYHYPADDRPVLFMLAWHYVPPKNSRCVPSEICTGTPSITSGIRSSSGSVLWSTFSDTVMWKPTGGRPFTGGRQVRRPMPTERTLGCLQKRSSYLGRISRWPSLPFGQRTVSLLLVLQPSMVSPHKPDNPGLTLSQGHHRKPPLVRRRRQLR